jgi:hypothetical protein
MRARAIDLEEAWARSVIVSDNQSFTALLVLMTINMLAFSDRDPDPGGVRVVVASRRQKIV